MIGAALKRALDLFAAALGIVALIPGMALVAVAIAADMVGQFSSASTGRVSTGARSLF